MVSVVLGPLSAAARIRRLRADDSAAHAAADAAVVAATDTAAALCDWESDAGCLRALLVLHGLIFPSFLPMPVKMGPAVLRFGRYFVAPQTLLAVEQRLFKQGEESAPTGRVHPLFPVVLLALVRHGMRGESEEEDTDLVAFVEDYVATPTFQPDVLLGPRTLVGWALYIWAFGNSNERESVLPSLTTLVTMLHARFGSRFHPDMQLADAGEQFVIPALLHRAGPRTNSKQLVLALHALVDAGAAVCWPPGLLVPRLSQRGPSEPADLDITSLGAYLRSAWFSLVVQADVLSAEWPPALEDAVCELETKLKRLEGDRFAWLTGAYQPVEGQGTGAGAGVGFEEPQCKVHMSAHADTALSTNATVWCMLRDFRIRIPSDNPSEEGAFRIVSEYAGMTAMFL